MGRLNRFKPKQVKDRITQGRETLEDWTWYPDAPDAPLWKRFLRRVVQVITLVVKGVLDRNTPVRAHALTYTTLLSILPLAALMLFVLRGVGVWEKLRDQVIPDFTNKYPELNSVTQTMIGYIEQTNFNSLGLAGAFFLFSTTITLLSQIENSFNGIWGAKEARSYFRKATDYMVIVLFVPIFVLMGFSLDTFVFQHFSAASPVMASLAGSSISMFLEYFLLGIGFSILFYFIPNTKVPWWAAAGGGFLGGFLFSIATSIYFGFQVGMANYNLIYSSLAALPMTFIWIDLSWIIILVSCEIGFALTYIKTYKQEMRADQYSSAFHEYSAVMITLAVARDFYDEERDPSTPQKLSDEFKLPVRFLKRLIDRLVAGGFLLDVEKNETYIVPAKPLLSCRFSEVIDAVRQCGEREEIQPGFEQWVDDFFSRREQVFKEHGMDPTVEDALKTMSNDVGSRTRQPTA